MPDIGQMLSHYRIVEKIGEGGMGQVYLADDTTLDRKAALKFLPEAFVSDPERMARFEREAKLLASLNHPNIAGIYGLEQADGNRFLVLEYVEGETLLARLGKGALPLEDALALCCQIAEGLEAAHEKGVLHRDLKPANVMIAADEKVKILDFGLAKALADETQRVDSSQSPTLTEAMTRPGVILGTAAYMSPEQAKGKSVDERADIWAFGCILYECLTGKKAFEGETATETLAAVIKEEPDWEALPTETGRHILFVLQRCLEKQRNHRFHHAADLRILLEENLNVVEKGTTVKQQRSPYAWIIAITCFIGALFFCFLYILQPNPDLQKLRFEVNVPGAPELTSFALSPDGHYLTYVTSLEGKQQLYLRQLDQVTAKPIPGTEGASFPFWSPNSQSVGFFAGGKLKIIDISGGLPQELADAPNGQGGTWNKDDIIVFAPAQLNPLFKVAATGGGAVAVTQLDGRRQTAHTFPHFLPDGQHLLYFAWGSERGIHISSLHSEGNSYLLPSNNPAIYAPPGYLLFLRQGVLFGQRFDAQKRVLIGDSTFRIADSVSVHRTYDHGGFSVSETGLLAYTTRESESRRLVWFDRAGHEVGTLGPIDEHYIMNPEISPDGTYVAVGRDHPDNNAIWTIEKSRPLFRRFIPDTTSQYFPIWSPDGETIAYSLYTNNWDIYQKSLNSAAKPELLLDSDGSEFPNDWSKDGKFLLYLVLDPQTGRDLWVLPMEESDRQPFTIVNTGFEELNGQFSPDARWIAYQSNQSGSFEIYAQPFPGPGGIELISTNGGVQPRWDPYGKELFYIAPDGNLMKVAIRVNGNTLSPGVPVPLFKANIASGGYMEIMKIQYDVSSDGQRFLMNTTLDKFTPSSITVVTDWTSEIKK